MSNIRRYKSRNTGRRGAQGQSAFGGIMEAMRSMDPKKRIMTIIAAVFVVVILLLVIVLAATKPEDSGLKKPEEGTLVPVETGGASTTPDASPSHSVSPSDEPSPSPTATPDTSKTLKAGAEGDDVKSLNERLASLGYLAEDKVSDKFSADTKKAVQAFQKANGLTSDGICGSKTLEAIYGDDAIKAKTQSGDGSGEYKTLKLKDRSDDVKKMQTRLKELGYNVSQATGYFGTETEKAVKDFQTKNSLTADGIAGEGTQKLLFSDSAKKAK